MPRKYPLLSSQDRWIRNFQASFKFNPDLLIRLGVNFLWFVRKPYWNFWSWSVEHGSTTVVKKCTKSLQSRLVYKKLTLVCKFKIIPKKRRHRTCSNTDKKCQFNTIKVRWVLTLERVYQFVFEVMRRSRVKFIWAKVTKYRLWGHRIKIYIVCR